MHNYGISAFVIISVFLLNSAGLIPRCAAELFKLIDSHLDLNSHWKHKVFFSYLEIYQEKVAIIVLLKIYIIHVYYF